MTDNTEYLIQYLILEHLGAIRASVAKLEESDTFIKARISSLEQQMAGARSEMAGIHSDMAALHNRMDSIEKRLDRIERRLELTSV